jgi:hypothetical protein
MVVGCDRRTRREVWRGVGEIACDPWEEIRTWQGLRAVLKRTDGGLVAKKGLALLHQVLPASSEGVDAGFP